jgi:hypothetical protein
MAGFCIPLPEKLLESPGWEFSGHGLPAGAVILGTEEVEGRGKGSAFE